GIDQPKHSAQNVGEISAFKTTEAMDVVTGKTKGYTRTILFVKPELVVVYDRLTADDPTFYEYWLHAQNEMKVSGQRSIRVNNDDVECEIDFLWPLNLELSQTDQYDPNPRPRVTLREWHLTAVTDGLEDSMEFITLYRPHKSSDTVPDDAEIERVRGGYALRAALTDGEFTALLPVEDGVRMSGFGMAGDTLTASIKRENGTVESIEMNDQ
ncbi:hypothetical protein ACFL6P_10005, partial [Candidatus Latescibacterota bacterium]